MKKILMSFCLLMCAVCTSLAHDENRTENYTYKFGMVVRSNDIMDVTKTGDDFSLERAQYKWFKENYIDQKQGIVINLTTDKDDALSQKIASCGTIWVVVAPYSGSYFGAAGYNLEIFQREDFVLALKKHVENGGNLYLSNFATKLVGNIGRVKSPYVPADGQSYKWPDTDNYPWYLCPLIGVTGNQGKIESEADARFNRWSHPIYNDITDTDVESYIKDDQFKVKSIPINKTIGSSERRNVYCFWALDNNEEAFTNFQNATNSVVLGTTEWSYWYNNAAIVEFKPSHSGDGKTVFDGTIIANGLAGCALGVNVTGTNSCEATVKKLNANILSYLASKQTNVTVDKGAISYSKDVPYVRGCDKSKTIAQLDWLGINEGQNGYWASLYCNQNKVLPEGMEAYVVSDVTDTKTSTVNSNIISRVAVLERVDTKRLSAPNDGVVQGKVAILPKNYGYLIRSNTKIEDASIVLPTTWVDANVDMSSYNTVYPTEANKTENKDKTYLYGSESKQTFTQPTGVAGTFYILCGERKKDSQEEWTYGFYIKKGTTGETIENAAHRAFIFVPNTGMSAAKSLLFTMNGFDSSTTGIEDHLNETTSARPTVYYNLSGQKVTPNYRGMVITKGKKFLKN